MSNARTNARKLLDAIRSLRGVNVGGRHFNLPLSTNFSIQEPWMTDVLRKFVPHFDGAFVDIGANIGQTLLQLRAIDSERQYIGFEPNPSCASYLLELVRLNSLSFTDVVPAACGVKYGIEKLFCYQDSLFDSSASMVPDFRPNSIVNQANYIVTVPVSECLRALGYKAIGVVKIDIEGYEATAIEALETELRERRPCIIIELLPVYSVDNEARLSNSKRVESVVERNAYSIFRILKSDQGRLKSFEALAEFGVHGDMSLVDYVLLPSESVSRVLASSI